MKVTRVAPVFPSLKTHSQCQNDDKSYSPRKPMEKSFASVLDKELQLKTSVKAK